MNNGGGTDETETDSFFELSSAHNSIYFAVSGNSHDHIPDYFSGVDRSGFRSAGTGISAQCRILSNLSADISGYRWKRHR